MIKLSPKYFLLSILFLFIEILIAIYIHDSLVRPYVGDIIVILLIYSIYRSFFSVNIKWVPICIFIFATAVELMQLVNIVSLLGLEDNRIARVVLGTTFDLKDIACYFVGTLLVIAWKKINNTALQMLVIFLAGLTSMVTFIILAYNGLWWPIDPVLMGYEIKGVDVARYQGDIDWEILHEKGIKFAFAKATEGSSYKDPYFDMNVINAEGAGIHTGAYHFFRTETTGHNQAENFLNSIIKYTLTMPPVLDFEVADNEDDIEKRRIINETKAFLLKVEEALGVKPLIYSTYESYYAYLIDDFGEYDFWMRDLIKQPSIPNGRIVIWQYCNRGRLEGIDASQKYVDLNVLFWLD